MRKTSPLDQLLAELQQGTSGRIDLGLERMQALLKALGHPEKRLPPVIHIAGTNGKGSLTAFLHAIVNAGGLRAHRYISPHLVRFNERITLADREIGDAALLDCVQRVRGPALALGATYFESTTAAAFLAFAETPADLAIIETGLGGRLDATNVLSPLLTALTPISMDHQAFLGDTLAAIAGEKAGILKPGIGCVVGPQAAEAVTVIERQAAVMRSPLYSFGEDWSVQPERQGFTYESQAWQLAGLEPSLPGRHQYDNAATAIACIECLAPVWPLGEEAVRSGLRHAVWPARLQRLRRGSWLRFLPHGSALWLDGGHNEGAASILTDWMRTRERPVHVICGMLADKDHGAFLGAIAPLAASVQCLTIPDCPQAASAQALAASIGARHPASIGVAAGLREALQRLCDDSAGACDILICGSLYLAGYVLADGRVKG